LFAGGKNIEQVPGGESNLVSEKGNGPCKRKRRGSVSPSRTITLKKRDRLKKGREKCKEKGRFWRQLETKWSSREKKRGTQEYQAEGRLTSGSIHMIERDRKAGREGGDSTTLSYKLPASVRRNGKDEESPMNLRKKGEGVL